MPVQATSLKSAFNRLGAFVEKHEKLRLKTQIMLDWWGTRVWKKTHSAVTPQGFVLTSGFHPAYKAMEEGRFESEETRLITQLLEKSDCFVDIGANLGYFTCIACQKQKTVIAIEPQKQNLKCLYQNLISNHWQDRVEIFPVALSEKAGLLTLYGASGPSASLISNWAGYSSRHQQTVPVLTLDTVLYGRSMDQPMLIKIDVEGAEFQVLKGASRVLSRKYKPFWIVEIFLKDFHPQNRNSFFEDTFELFEENGYAAYTASERPVLISEKDIHQWVNSNALDFTTHNYLFVDRHIDVCDLLRTS